MLLSFGFILQALLNRKVSANTTDFSTCGYVRSHFFSSANWSRYFYFQEENPQSATIAGSTQFTSPATPFLQPDKAHRAITRTFFLEPYPMTNQFFNVLALTFS